MTDHPDDPGDEDEREDTDDPALPPLAEPEPDDLDTIRFFERGGVLRLALQDVRRGRRSIEAFTAGGILRQLDRTVVGLTASQAGLAVASRSRAWVRATASNGSRKRLGRVPDHPWWRDVLDR